MIFQLIFPDQDTSAERNISVFSGIWSSHRVFILVVLLIAGGFGCQTGAEIGAQSSVEAKKVLPGDIMYGEENIRPHSSMEVAKVLPEGGFIGRLGGPPMNPESWHKVEKDVMHYKEAWGYRVMPRGVFQIPGGVGLLYNSKPPHDYRGDGALTQTGSLAFTRNLLDWHDYPGNPVMYEIQHEWQGIWRVMPRAMLYDERNGQWVVYTGDADGPYPGIRAVGTAYSRDLVNWTMDEKITMTVEDYADEVAELSRRSPEEIIERGRIYADWAIYYDDRYFLYVSGFLFVSDEPGGPFSYFDGFKGDLMPNQQPAYWNGKWYTVITGNWNGRPGIGLAWADDLMGPYHENPDNPIFEVETTSRARPQILRYHGVWAVIYSHTYDEDVNRMSLRAALANIHPDILIFQ